MVRFSSVALLAALSFFACTPSANSLPCQNDAQCAKASPDFRYCAESRCVACVGSPDCGDGKQCIAGKCLNSCKSNAQCTGDDKCVDEVCRSKGD